MINRSQLMHKIKKARQYCIEKGYSLEKFDAQRSQMLFDDLYFLQKSGVEPKGCSPLLLANDLETMPFPTLIVHSDNTIETTEYTEKYLR